MCRQQTQSSPLPHHTNPISRACGCQEVSSPAAGHWDPQGRRVHGPQVWPLTLTWPDHLHWDVPTEVWGCFCFNIKNLSWAKMLSLLKMVLVPDTWMRPLRTGVWAAGMKRGYLSGARCCYVPELSFHT